MNKLAATISASSNIKNTVNLKARDYWRQMRSENLEVCHVSLNKSWPQRGPGSFFGPRCSCLCAGSAAGEEPGAEIDHPGWNTPHKKDGADVCRDDPTLFPWLGQRERAEHSPILADHKPWRIREALLSCVHLYWAGERHRSNILET